MLIDAQTECTQVALALLLNWNIMFNLDERLTMLQCVNMAQIHIIESM